MSSSLRGYPALLARGGCHKYTEKFPKSEVFELRSQLRRAAISIESCIAEGFCRYYYKSRLNFYYDARGSVGEVQSQVITSKDLGYMASETSKEIIDQLEKAAVILGGLIRSTERLSKK